MFFDDWMSVIDLLHARGDAEKLGFEVLLVLILIHGTPVVLRTGRKLALGRRHDQYILTLLDLWWLRLKFILQRLHRCIEVFGGRL